jgi:hypothetical protein
VRYKWRRRRTLVRFVVLKLSSSKVDVTVGYIASSYRTSLSV